MKTLIQEDGLDYSGRNRLGNPQIILHIPHSSIHITDTTGYVVNNQIIQQEIFNLTDWYTDELFSNASDRAIVAPFSRIFCDPERFTDDTQEVMAQYGMGVLYKKTNSGLTMRKVSADLRKRTLKNHYQPHHDKLNAATEQQLKQFGLALIIDCHSFPDEPLQRELDKRPNRPDFNIGTDGFHTPPELIRSAEQFFTERGYSVGTDWPFSGTMVPFRYYQNNPKVHSFMLEVNRRLYLKPRTNQKSSNFENIRTVVQAFLNTKRLELQVSN